MRRAVQGLAAILILVGLVALGQFGWNLWREHNTEQQESQQWKDLVGAAAGQGSDDPGLAKGLYLRLIMPKLNNKDAVAIDSDWTGLRVSSMVHYKSSPAPGQKGNVLVAFHRETHWMDVDQVGAGDQVLIETLDKTVYRYVIDFVKTVKPSDVSWLKPTDGNDLTLITCDPPWRDYNRLIYRAHLVTKAPAGNSI